MKLAEMMGGHLSITIWNLKGPIALDSGSDTVAGFSPVTRGQDFFRGC